MATFQLTYTIPPALITRIVAAMHTRYPDLTAGLTDLQTAHVVVKAMVKQLLSEVEAANANPSPLQVQLDQLAAAYNVTFTTAYNKASTDTDTGMVI